MKEQKYALSTSYGICLQNSYLKLSNEQFHYFREDYMVEAMEVVEMYCDLVLARFGLVTQMKELDSGLAEAVSSLLWVAPRMQSDIQELKGTFHYCILFNYLCNVLIGSFFD